MPVEDIPDDYESVIHLLDDLKTRVEELERQMAALRPAEPLATHEPGEDPAVAMDDKPRFEEADFKDK